MFKRNTIHVLVATFVALLSTAALLFLLRTSAPAQAAPSADTIFLHCVQPPLSLCPLRCTMIFAQCYSNIQAAVDAADAGETILVQRGLFTGTHLRGGALQVVYISKTVTLRGGYDSSFNHSHPLTQPTVVDAEGQGRVIYVDGSGGTISPTIEGLWVTGGNASHALVDAGLGGGIRSESANPIIANNVISHNVAYTSASSIGQGGGIAVSNMPGTAVISANRVISNVASIAYRGYGGGIFVAGGVGAEVMNNVVLSNTASITGGTGHGGGIYLQSSHGAIATGNQVEHNLAHTGLGLGSDGGGIGVKSSHDVVLAHNLVRHNVASLQSSGGGGGIDLDQSFRARIEGNTVEANQATWTGYGSGGGFRATYSEDVLLIGNRVVSNTARVGGGCYLSRDTTFTMTNNLVAANGAQDEGGGVAFDADGPSLAVTGTLLHNTFAANDRGAGEGRSAIHTSDPYASLVLTNNLITSHTYGIIVVPTSTVRLHNTLFYANGTDTSGAGTITDTDPITGQDPLLDPTYHLQAGSPAIGAGADAGVATDVDGDSRIGLPDVGIDEFITTIALPLVLRDR